VWQAETRKSLSAKMGLGFVSMSQEDRARLSSFASELPS
jgi:hypothetical protein